MTDSIRVYNSLTKQKEIFKPNEAGKLGIYICGITVYDFCHLGHARAYVSFDVIIRHFKARGYEVNYIRNITDIDDKIIKRSQENNESYHDLTERMIAAMHEDFDALNLLKPNKEPRATETIPGMIAMIETLIDKGYAYPADNGDVFYEVSRFETYGKLSKKDLSGQQAGSRVEVVSEKRHPLDFVLWKKAKEGEPSWDSPWGKGRPGWHIECSVMSKSCLGDNFDIHGGGFDLQFPHHENEIAQSEAANEKTFANYWMHVGFLQVNHEKMSKSLNNFFTVRDVLEVYHPETVRYFLISSHYRSQLNYSQDNLDNAKAALEKLYQTLSDVDIAQSFSLEQDDQVAKFNQAMDDDFNTPVALSVLFELSKEINSLKNCDKEKAGQKAYVLKTLANRLGILGLAPEDFLKRQVDDAFSQKIEALIVERNQARADKNWQRADEIRDELKSLGISLLDSKDGKTTWRKD